MSRQRHLQGEIDRTLKQVDEGNDLFLQFLKKFQSAPPGTQKDKFEREMGREIKKLQRHRDNIRVWVSSADVKDKNALLEAKRKIEGQMEAFKACEKETKTKAYSREGLSASGKIDPVEEEKTAAREWIQDTQRKFMDQINCIEAELESLTSSRRARDADTLEHLQSSKDKLQYHYDTLDLLLRKCENEGCINAEKFQELQEVAECFITADFSNECEDAFQQVYDDLEILKSGSLLGSSGSVEEDSNSVHSDTISSTGKKSSSKKTVPEPAKRLTVLPPGKPDLKPDERQGRDVKPTTPSVWDFPSLARSTSAPVADKQAREAIPVIEKPPLMPVDDPKPPIPPPQEKPTLGSFLGKIDEEMETQMMEVEDMDAAQELIDTSFFYAIRPDDRARPSLIVLNTPFPCHPSFPKCPLFREAERIKQVDLDTLFFIFYHQPGTYQQYLAAGYLQKRNWLYHKKEQTWFQREDSGRAKTPGKGTYFYFDYTASWSQRLRQDFVFESQHLESAVTE